jgi:hypothetical protein
MNGVDGDNNEMFRSRHNRYELDEHTAEGIVAGRVGADDAPPAYAPVAELLIAARGPSQAHELEGEEAVVAMFTAERGALAPQPTHNGRKRMLPQLLTAKAAAAALVGAMALGGGVAAAATGHLPDAAQGVAHDVVAHIGVSIPDAPSKSQGKGQDIKTTAQDPTTSGQGKGQAVCTQASDGKCQAGQHGQGDQHKPADAGNPANRGKPADPGQSGSPTSTTPTTDPAGPTATTPGTSVPSGPPTSVPPVSIPARSGR